MFLSFVLGGLVATIALAIMPIGTRTVILDYFDRSKRAGKE